MISQARRAAYDVTRAVDIGRLDLASALADTRDALEDGRDRALATEIAVGTQRWRGQLDFLIEHASGRDLARLDPEVLVILRISAYQLIHLTRVPASAIVNDGVELTRRARKRSASGLVNAVLRKLAASTPPLPDLPTAEAGTDEWIAQAVAHLSIAGSHPAWLVRRWIDRYGWEAAASWVTFNNAVPPVTLWPSPAGRRDGHMPAWPPHHPTMWVPGGAVLDEGQTAIRLLHQHDAYAQDEASAAVAAVTAVAAMATPGSVLDACAAPGGKTLVLADTLPRDTMLLAADLRAGRVTTVARLIERLAGRPVPTIRADAAALPFASSLGTVLVDAPCSGLGTLRRDPDIRWRRQPGDLPDFAEQQRAMVRSACGAIRPGGRVVYATCSSEPEENEDLIRDGVRRGDWRVLDLRTLLLPGRVAELIAAEGWLRTLPSSHGLESFFAVALVGSDQPGRVESTR